ncbi:MAG TPA: hypothetical protein VH025_04975 [Solirubrobacteraceae bacterium]|jgi:hypothetical protein|nr:hypothetical protein [Solirubrobacteraceae bacterium]
MNGNGYKLLGFVVWQGGRWYLRRKLSPRRLLARGAVAGVAVIGGAVAVKRLAG